MKRGWIPLLWVAIGALALYTYIQFLEIAREAESFVEYTELPQGNTVNAIGIDLPDTLYFAGEMVDLAGPGPNPDPLAPLLPEAGEG